MKILIYPLVALFAWLWIPNSRADEPNLGDLMTRLESSDYAIRKAVVTELLHLQEKRPLKKEEIGLLFLGVSQDERRAFDGRLLLLQTGLRCGGESRAC